jgi:ParB family chromosome partitioning protein
MKRLTQYDVYELPIEEIFYDAGFNCRGDFTPQSVHELSESIDEIGLQFPVVVHPYKRRKGFKYRLLAGHRRYKAVTMFLKWTQIPAVIRTDLNERSCRVLNLTENLERKDLNILEEARALHNLYPKGVSLRVASKELKRPTRWVHARLRLLELPEEVQKLAAAGVIPAYQIEAIHKLETPEAQIEAAQAYAKSPTRIGRKSRVPTRYRRKFRDRRTKQQISDMIDHLINVHCDGLTTRLLAWTMGRLTEEEIEKDIQNEPTYHPEH